MAVTRDEILGALSRLTLPGGEDLVSRDMIRALTIEGGAVRFVIEAADPTEASKMDGVRRAAEDIVRRLPGVEINGLRLKQGLHFDLAPLVLHLYLLEADPLVGGMLVDEVQPRRAFGHDVAGQELSHHPHHRQ